MSEFLQNNLLIIVICLLFIILLLIVLIGLILVKLVLSSKEKNSSASLNPPEILPSKKELHHGKMPEQVVEKFYCHNHPEENSSGGCLICEDVFCESCLVEHEGLYFCKEHFKIFANHQWKQITDVKTTPDTPNDGLYIYQFKRNLWQAEKIPSFVLTHYKINIENDFIESFVQLNVREEDADKLEVEIEKFKALQ